MNEFGHCPAFPLPVVYDPDREQINAGAQYGHAAGLNIQQHVWLTLFAGHMADPNASYGAAMRGADAALPMALKRLEQLA